jgi:hypothetical protein
MPTGSAEVIAEHVFNILHRFQESKEAMKTNREDAVAKVGRRKQRVGLEKGALPGLAAVVRWAEERPRRGLPMTILAAPPLYSPPGELLRPTAEFLHDLHSSSLQDEPPDRANSTMSLSSKLSIQDVDLKGKRVLIRVCSTFLHFHPPLKLIE